MNITGGELHRMSPGGSAAWHVGPRRQYVITLSGRGEIEVAGGQKIEVGPGHIDLIEDTTGKGHITRNLEDRPAWRPRPAEPPALPPQGSGPGRWFREWSPSWPSFGAQHSHLDPVPRGGSSPRGRIGGRILLRPAIGA